jgi:lipopolysaccharide export system protein LptA
MANFKDTDSNISRAISTARVLLLALLPLLAAELAVGAPLGQSKENITVESDGAEVDARTKQFFLPKARIAQGGYVIQADEARATGLDFDNSTWIFNGKVKINTPDGSSNAEHATVRFVHKEIIEIHIAGEPATFEQHDEAKRILAQGRAGTIDYDVQKNTVRMSQQAWVKYGQNEFTGTTVVYDINNQRVLASREEQQGERVRITINPNSDQPAIITPLKKDKQSSKP